jgi:geranylgeranyl diphosphate synthase, type I
MLSTEDLGWLIQYGNLIDAQLADLFPANPRTTLERAVVESLSSGGKRVRSVLALLMCEVFSNDYRPALPVAVAYELAHACALIQDDIIDSSEMRRGSQSIVGKYGLSNAILASDLLLFNVPKIMSKYDKLESKKLSKLFDLLGEACRGATWGEFLDLELAKSDKASEAEYEEMIRSKTGALLAGSSASGAIIGNASDEEIELAYNIGEQLGMAYQIRDDALDLFGTEEALGKPIFTDIRAGKKNLILIHCLNHCTYSEKEFLRSLFNRIGEYESKEVMKVRRILENYGSLSYATTRSSLYVEEAKKLTSLLPDSRAKNSLIQLLDYLSERYY